MITRTEAERELKLAAKLNPGAWEQHSISVATNARLIAEKVAGMDGELPIGFRQWVVHFAGILMQQMEQKPELRVAVMSIKQELISKKLYGLDKAKMHYHSKEIYDAVFNRGILSAEQFMMTYAPNN